MKQDQKQLDNLRRMYAFHCKQVPQPLKILERLEEQIIFLQELLEPNPATGSQRAGATPPPAVSPSLSSSSGSLTTAVSSSVPSSSGRMRDAKYALDSPLNLVSLLPVSPDLKKSYLELLRRRPKTAENTLNTNICVSLLKKNVKINPLQLYLFNPALLAQQLPLTAGEQKKYLQELKVWPHNDKIAGSKIIVRSLLELNKKPGIESYLQNPLLMISMLPLSTEEIKVCRAELLRMTSPEDPLNHGICLSLLRISSPDFIEYRNEVESKSGKEITGDVSGSLATVKDWLDLLRELSGKLNKLSYYQGSSQQEYILDLRSTLLDYQILLKKSSQASDLLTEFSGTQIFQSSMKNDFTDEECLMLVSQMLNIYRVDLREGEHNVQKWLGSRQEPKVRESLTGFLTQIQIVLKILSLAPDRLNAGHARQIFTLWTEWRAAKEDLLKNNAAALTPLTPEATFLSVAPELKPEKIMTTKTHIVCEWLRDEGVWIPFEAKDSLRILEAFQQQRENLNLELKIDGTAYKIFFADGGLQQQNLQSQTHRPIRMHNQWDKEGPSIWQILAPSLRKREFCLIGIPMRADDEIISVIRGFHEGCPDYVILDIRLNYNPEKWLKYWQLRESYRARLGGRCEERGLWHGTDAENVPFICRQGFRSDYTVNHLYGKGSYFARDPNYPLHPNYAALASDQSQTLIYAYVAVGDVAEGTKDTRQPPLKTSITDGKDMTRYENTVDQLVSTTIYVTYDDNQVYPALVVKVRKDPEAAKIQHQTQSYPVPQDSKVIKPTADDDDNLFLPWTQLAGSFPDMAADLPAPVASHPVSAGSSSASMVACSSSSSSSSMTGGNMRIFSALASSSSPSSSAITTGGSPALFGSSTSSTPTGGTPSGSVPGSASLGATT